MVVADERRGDGPVVLGGDLDRVGFDDDIADRDDVAALVDRLYQPGTDYSMVNKVLALVVFQEWYELYLV